MEKVSRPVRVLQYGEGNFLRAFADWMLDIANEKGVTNLGIAVVSPRFKQNRSIELLQKQQCNYNVQLEGIDHGEAKRTTRRVTVIDRAIAPTVDKEAYLNVIELPELRFVISNTTEAGIAYAPDDVTADLPATFPGKVTAMLLHRWKHFDGDPARGLIFLCCELIDNNGSTLKAIVKRHAVENNLPEDFIAWVDENCIFSDTLVDRIVSGFPAERPAELADDDLLVVGEMYHNWVIGGEGWEQIKQELPLHEAGLNVTFTPDVSAYRERKVRVLNGCHTAMTPIALQLGCSTVLDAVSNPLIKRFIKLMLSAEILPNLKGDKAELAAFADEILERFRNPYIKHRLTSILLNSYAKWQTRNCPTLNDTLRASGSLAVCQLFALAALNVLAKDSDFTETIGPEAPHDDTWKSDCRLAELTDRFTRDITALGMEKALSQFLDAYETSHSH